MDIPEYCRSNANAVLPDPDSCAGFYDCKDPANNYQRECEYPKLFNVEKGMCEDFIDVTCKDRPEPQAPCKLHQGPSYQ